MTIAAYLEREKRADLRAGVIAATIENVAPKARSVKAKTPADYFASLEVQHEFPKKEQTPQEHRNRLIALAKATGARIIQRSKDSK